MRFRHRRYRVVRRSDWDPDVHRCQPPRVTLGFRAGAVIECPCGQQWRLEPNPPGRWKWTKHQRQETG